MTISSTIVTLYERSDMKYNHSLTILRDRVELSNFSGFTVGFRVAGATSFVGSHELLADVFGFMYGSRVGRQRAWFHV